MRPYRGKRKDNGEWVYGWLIKDRKCFIAPPHPTTYLGAMFSSSRGYSIGPFYEVDPATVGQSTGLKDKNGKEEKECYGGDVIKVKDGDGEARGFVFMNETLGQWMWRATETYKTITISKDMEIPLWKVLDKTYRFKGKVIGTIHDKEKDNGRV